MDTGPDFHEERALNDGTLVALRHIRPEDAAELKRGFDHLSPASRHRRFLGAALTSLSDEQLRYLTNVDQDRHVAIVAETVPADGSAPVGLGVARYVREADDPAVAEVAITVADEWQGKGLGRILALTLARAAHERGVQRFRGEVLADNAAIRGLLADVGAVFHEEPEGVVFDVELTNARFEPGGRLDVVARKMLRAAATFLAGLFGGFRDNARK